MNILTNLTSSISILNILKFKINKNTLFLHMKFCKYNGIVNIFHFQNYIQNLLRHNHNLFFLNNTLYSQINSQINRILLRYNYNSHCNHLDYLDKILMLDLLN